MAEVFVKLYHLNDALEWRVAAERLIAAFAGAEPGELANAPSLLAAFDNLARGGCLVVEGEALLAAALAHADPTLAVFPLDRKLWPRGLPGGRPAPPQGPAAMLCRGQTCSLPVYDAAELEALLRA